MKHQRDKTKIMFRYLSGWILAMLFLFYALFLLTPIAMAQKEPDVSAQPLKINGKEVKQYLMDKYKVPKDNVISTLKQTPSGTNGSLHIRGNLTPKKMIAPKEEKHGRARAIAEAFLAEESTSLFGITNLADIRERVQCIWRWSDTHSILSICGQFAA